MKVIKRLSVIGFMVASFAPRAEVNIEFDRDISPLLVGGEEVGYSFFSKSGYTVPDGTNQVVLKVSKLVEKLGEKEKFNSKAFVLTFTEENEQLLIAPDAKIMRLDQAEDFDTNPRFSVTNKQGQNVKYDLDELPNLGGITRDFEKELAKFNSKHYPELIAASSTVAVTANASNATKDSSTATDPMQPSQNNMMEYWMQQASDEDIEQFTEIAFEGRNKSEVEIPQDASQPVQMLGYWFNKANSAERKKVLAHLISL